jgi:hypothetical protein
VRLAAGWFGSKEIPIDIRHGEIVRMQCRQKAAPWSLPLYVIRRNAYIFLETVKT